MIARFSQTDLQIDFFFFLVFLFFFSNLCDLPIQETQKKHENDNSQKSLNEFGPTLCKNVPVMKFFAD